MDDKSRPIGEVRGAETPKERKNYAHIWPILLLTILCFLIGALIFRTKFVVTLPFEKGSSPWTQVPWQAIMTFLVAVGGLVTWFFTTTQRERHFLQEQREKRLQFERSSMDAQFKDIQDRLSDDNPTVRGNAVIQLAQYAQRIRYAEGDSQESEYFGAASSQLSLALLSESDIGVRDEVLKAVTRLATYAADHRPILIVDLVDALAGSSRNALERFTDLLAKNYPKVWMPGVINLDSELLSLVDFCEEHQHNEACILSVMNAEEFRKRQRYYSSWPKLRGEGIEADQISVCARNLDDLAYAMAETLRALPARPAPVTTNGEYPRVDLDGVWLCGQDLSQSDLRWVSLNQSHLIATNLGTCNLEGVSLAEVKADFADFDEANLNAVYAYKSTFRFANFWLADLVESSLWGSDFSQANFSGANLQSANLAHCRCWGVRLTGQMVGYDPDLPDDFEHTARANVFHCNIEGCSIDPKNKRFRDYDTIDQNILMYCRSFGNSIVETIVPGQKGKDQLPKEDDLDSTLIWEVYVSHSEDSFQSDLEIWEDMGRSPRIERLDPTTHESKTEEAFDKMLAELTFGVNEESKSEMLVHLVSMAAIPAISAVKNTFGFEHLIDESEVKIHSDGDLILDTTLEDLIDDLESNIYDSIESLYLSSSPRISGYIVHYLPNDELDDQDAGD